MRKVTVYASNKKKICSFTVSDDCTDTAALNRAYSHARANGYAVGRVHIKNGCVCPTVSVIAMAWAALTLFFAVGGVWLLSLPDMPLETFITTVVVVGGITAVSAVNTVEHFFGENVR